MDGDVISIRVDYKVRSFRPGQQSGRAQSRPSEQQMPLSPTQWPGRRAFLLSESRRTGAGFSAAAEKSFRHTLASSDLRGLMAEGIVDYSWNSGGGGGVRPLSWLVTLIGAGMSPWNSGSSLSVGPNWIVYRSCCRSWRDCPPGP